MSSENAPRDERFMAQAIALAARGEGHVEPNPMVGCVIVRDETVVGEGWHQQFGGPHAEVEALRDAGEAARGGTTYVSLEPCCHVGKTPPCADALIAAGVARVVIATRDPFPQVAGKGIDSLRAAGVGVTVGVLEDDARDVLAPYLHRIATGRPWVIAKWAMTLDGKIATASGDSQWISNERSRAVVHALRGRVDALIVGRKTAERDDPLLTARPPGPRTATRIVVDSNASLSLDSQLARTANDAPVLVAASSSAPNEKCSALEAAGVEVLRLAGEAPNDRLAALLDALGQRGMTNVLVEGGGELLGGLFDMNAINEVHAFIAPKLLGGANAPSPVAGAGRRSMGHAARFEKIDCEFLDGDMHFHAKCAVDRI